MRGAVLALPVLALPAAAHPVDELVQGAYLTLAPGEVRLELELMPGEEVLPLILPVLDPDGDGSVSDAEARTFAEDVLETSTLTLDGEATPWTLIAAVPPDLSVAAEGAAAMRIEATAPRSDREGQHTLVYETQYEPAKSLWMANVFLLPSEGWAYDISGQERDERGQALTVHYEAMPG